MIKGDQKRKMIMKLNKPSKVNFFKWKLNDKQSTPDMQRNENEMSIRSLRPIKCLGVKTLRFMNSKFDDWRLKRAKKGMLEKFDNNEKFGFWKIGISQPKWWGQRVRMKRCLLLLSERLGFKGSFPLTVDNCHHRIKMHHNNTRPIERVEPWIFYSLGYLPSLGSRCCTKRFFLLLQNLPYLLQITYFDDNKPPSIRFISHTVMCPA